MAEVFFKDISTFLNKQKSDKALQKFKKLQQFNGLFAKLF